MRVRLAALGRQISGEILFDRAFGPPCRLSGRRRWIFRCGGSPFTSEVNFQSKYDQFGPCVLNALMPRFSFVPILLESLTLFLQSLKRERAEVKALLRLRNRTMD